MIIGIGTDLVDIRRIEQTYERFGERFLHRTYTQAEIDYVLSQKNIAAKLAQRWAAKEACAKALNTGIRGVVTLKSIEICRHHNGAPSITLNDAVMNLLAQKIPSGCSPVIHLSMSDEQFMASAFVVISAANKTA